VLLSDAFLDTHCFNLRTDGEAAPGLIGLAFEPVRGRPRPDIGGTLWLDPSTAQLERLDFTYRNLNLPRTLITSGIGGSLEFEALPNGTWIVDSWRIRMPKAGMGTNLVSGGGTAILEEIIVQGGDVVRVHDNQGATVLEAELAGGIAGVVRDTLREGLPNARVFVQGTGIESFTDSDGRFQLTGLDPGVYAVTFDHPYLEPYAYIPEPFEVEVLVAEVGRTVAEDRLFKVTYDGTLYDKRGYTAIGGQADELSDRLGEDYEGTPGLAEALALTANAFREVEGRVIHGWEGALLAREGPPRRFRRLTKEELGEIATS